MNENTKTLVKLSSVTPDFVGMPQDPCMCHSTLSTCTLSYQSSFLPPSLTGMPSPVFYLHSVCLALLQLCTCCPDLVTGHSCLPRRCDESVAQLPSRWGLFLGCACSPPVWLWITSADGDLYISVISIIHCKTVLMKTYITEVMRQY
jgi:hypothetical protein